VRRYAFDFGPITIAGAPRAADGVVEGYAPRRVVLDEILVRAAEEAGAEVREDFTVDGLLFGEDGSVRGIRGQARGGTTVEERARVVVGADGKRSLVAKAVGAGQYQDVPQLQTGYYAYWSDLPVDGFETFIRAEHGRGWAALPTNDDLTCVVGGWPYREFEANRKDYERHHLAMFDLEPAFAERLAQARRETRLRAVGDLRGYFRKPYGPGWALVGDAGYHKDPITAFGITDAFRDAELASGAIDDALTGRRAYDEAMGEWHLARDEASMPVYGMTCDIARIEPPPPDQLQLFGAVAGNAEASADFISVMAGTLSPAAFFAPENVARMMGGPAEPAPA
jgi:flavin-dependent dehydrogenase